MSYHLSEIGKEIRGTAEWRRHTAVDFPHHTDRNLDAAEELDYLAAEIEQLEGADIEQQIGEAGKALEQACQATDYDTAELDLDARVSAKLRAIGFHGSCWHAIPFLEWYRDLLRRKLERVRQADLRQSA